MQCWLTIPILIYLTMVPMWSRARRFANVYAFAALDMLSVILWLSAWASTASYVAQGKSEGNADNNDQNKSGCDNFKYGSAGRCQLSTGITILGVFIMLAFVATSWFSFRALMEYKRTGIAPNNGLDNDRKYDFHAQTQGDFDTTMHNNSFDEANAAERQARQSHSYGGGGGPGRYDGSDDDDAYAPIHQRDPSDMHAQEPLSPLGPQPTAPYGPNSYGTGGGFQDQPTGYGGVGGYR
jgi:translocation protein SEC72